MSSRPRPDPSRGVFETLLVLDGRPLDLDAHLARLQASLTALYPHHAPPPLDAPVLRRLYGHRSTGTSDGGTEALRITVAPSADDGTDADGELRVEVAVREVEPELVFDPPPVSLRGLTLAGGLGAHKWADRSLLDAAQARIGDEELPLLIDADGAVLEAARANLFAVRDGALFTPPLDGRILPGITRARVLEIAAENGIETDERTLCRDDLLAADEVLLSGSVRGVEPVGALDGAPLAGDGALGPGLAAALRPAAQPGGSLNSSLVTR